MAETLPPLRTQNEINIEYSRLATMNGDKHYRRGLLQSEVQKLESEIDSIQAEMTKLAMEKVKPELLADPIVQTHHND